MNPKARLASSHKQMNPRTALLPRLGLTLLLGVLFLVACDWHGLRGNGDLKTENRSLTPFANLDVSGAFTIDWATGSPAVSIVTDENLLNHVRTRVSGDKLIIDTDTHISPRRGLKVTVTSQNLRGAQLSGAVRFEAEKLAGPSFFLETSGASRATLEGTVGDLTASMTGASRLDAENLHTRTAALSVTGAGRADVWASEVLKVSISGAGRVTYSGNPKEVKRDISGAGKVRAKD
jgi:Putative auto-transporter adhesin, head GIN domain